MDNPELLKRIRIRQATIHDAGRMEWEGELIHFRRLFMDALESASRGASQVWLAELDSSRLVGQLMLSLRSSRPELSDGAHRAYLYGFRVREKYRSQGIGTLMMRKVEAELARKGYEEIVLNVAQENLSARRLYERLGYAVIAPDPGEWSYLDHQGVRRDMHEPAWRMRRSLLKK